MTKKMPSEVSERIQEAYKIQGALGAINRMKQSLDSSLIHGLILIEEKKYWRELGFDDFGNYLDLNDSLPFKRQKFYDLKKLLFAEGDARFDLLTGYKISPATRLLLAENNVEIEIDGNDIVIQGDRIPADDKSAVTQVIKAVKDALVLRDHRESADKKKIEKLQKTIDSKDLTITNIKNSQLIGTITNDDYVNAYLELGGAFEKIIKETEKLSPASKRNWRDKVFVNFIMPKIAVLSKAFDLQGSGLDLKPMEPIVPSGDDQQDEVEAMIAKALEYDGDPDEDSENDTELVGLL